MSVLDAGTTAWLRGGLMLECASQLHSRTTSRRTPAPRFVPFTVPKTKLTMSQAMTRSTIQGPEFVNGKTYTKADSLTTQSMVWSPCGASGILNVNNRIALTSNVSGAKGEVTNDDATFKFTQTVRVNWRRCG